MLLTLYFKVQQTLIKMPCDLFICLIYMLWSSSHLPIIDKRIKLLPIFASSPALMTHFVTSVCSPFRNVATYSNTIVMRNKY